MPVSTEISVSGPYFPNGVTTDFPFDFKAASASEIGVVDGGGATVSSALYSVSLSVGEGGTVAFLVAPSADDYDALYIVNDVALTQPDDFSNSGPSYNPQALTRALDRAVIRDLKQQEQLDRALKTGRWDTIGALPDAAARAGKLLSFDGDGDPSVTVISDAIEQTVAEVQAAMDADVIASQAARTGAEAARDQAQAWAESPTAPDGAAGKSSKTWAGVSQGSATDSQNYSIVAGNNAASAATSATLALGAQGILGPETTYANLVAHIGSYANNDLIRVTADETHGGQVSIYKKVSGSPVYQDGGQVPTQYDNQARPFISRRLVTDHQMGLKLKKTLWNKLNGFDKELRVMLVGADSFDLYSFQTFYQWMLAELEGWFATTPLYAQAVATLPTNYGTAVGYAATTFNPYSFTGTARNKTDYDIADDGTCMVLAAGQASSYGVAGVNSCWCDYALIEIAMESGAGSVRIKVVEAATVPANGSGTWRNFTSGEIPATIQPGIPNGVTSLTAGELIVNANGTFGPIIVKVAFATLAQRGFLYENTGGGSVRILPMFGGVATASSIGIWRHASPSNDTANILSVSDPFMVARINAFQPDWIIAANDDKLNGWQTLLPRLASRIAASSMTAKPHVTLVGSGFYSNPPNYNDQSIISAIDYMHSFVAGRRGWNVVDGMAIGGGLAEFTANGEASDGIHPTTIGSRIIAHQACQDMGILPPYLPAPGRAASASDVMLPAVDRGGDRLIPARLAAAQQALPTIDTGNGTIVWSNTGGTAIATDNGGNKTVATTISANSPSAALINIATSLLGNNQGLISGSKVRSWQTRIQSNSTWDAQTQALILMRSNSSFPFNTGYTWPIVNEAHGFRVWNDGTTTWVEAFCWDAGALVTSVAKTALTVGGTASLMDLAIDAEPGVINASRGYMNFWSRGLLLMRSTYAHAGALHPPRVEITNGTTAALKSIKFTPPRITMQPS